MKNHNIYKQFITLLFFGIGMVVHGQNYIQPSTNSFNNGDCHTVGVDNCYTPNGGMQYIATEGAPSKPFFSIEQWKKNPSNPFIPTSYAIDKTHLIVKQNGNIGIGLNNPQAKLHINGSIRGGQTGGALKLQTAYGYLQMGAVNNGFMHFVTDKSRFYFNKKIVINEGIISSYNHLDLQLQTNYDTKVIIEDATGNLVVNGGDLILKGNFPNTLGDTEIKLSANTGVIRAREIKVDLAEIPDYVFSEEYNLMPLYELNSYIKKNKHLPNVKSEAAFQEEGSINLTEMNLTLLEKVEELTLYILNLQDQINTFKK